MGPLRVHVGRLSRRAQHVPGGDRNRQHSDGRQDLGRQPGRPSPVPTLRAGRAGRGDGRQAPRRVAVARRARPVEWYGRGVIPRARRFVAVLAELAVFMLVSRLIGVMPPRQPEGEHRVLHCPLAGQVGADRAGPLGRRPRGRAFQRYGLILRRAGHVRRPLGAVRPLSIVQPPRVVRPLSAVRPLSIVRLLRQPFCRRGEAHRRLHVVRPGRGVTGRDLVPRCRRTTRLAQHHRPLDRGRGRFALTGVGSRYGTVAGRDGEPGRRQLHPPAGLGGHPAEQRPE